MGLLVAVSLRHDSSARRGNRGQSQVPGKDQSFLKAPLAPVAKGGVAMKSVAVFGLTILLFLAVAPTAAVDGATPIWEPTTVTEPGRYALTRNIAALPGQSAIVIDASGVEIDLNGFTISGSNAPVISSSNNNWIAIRNGVIEGGVMGITIENARDVVIEGLSIHDVERAAVYLTPTGPYRIVENTVGDLGDPDNFAIIVERPAGSEGPGRVEDNLLRMVSGGIKLTGGGSDVIRANDIEYTTLMEGILIEDCAGCNVSDNKITFFATTGMIVRRSEGCRVGGNLVVAPEGLDGIVIDDCSGILIESNTVANCRNGLKAAGTRLSHIERNVLTRNREIGLWLDGNARDNTYGRNTARGNAGTACTAPPGPRNGPDFCDEGSGNSSFGDNLMPDAK